MSVVAAGLVEDLRPEPDVADGAQAVAGFGHRHPAAAVRHPVEQRQQLRVRPAPRSGRAPRWRASGRRRRWRARSRAPADRAAISACSAVSAAWAAFSSIASASASSMRSSIRVSKSLISCSATLISFCIAWYSLLVFTSISWFLYLLRRPWTAARSFSISRRAAWLAATRALTASTAAVRSASRASSAACRTGMSATRRRWRSAAESSSWR